MKSAHSPLKKALSLLLVLLMLGTASPAVLAADSVSITGRYAQTDARKMLKDINAFRTGSEAWYWNEDNKTKTKCKNLKALKYDYTLEKIAMQRAAEITVKWDHTRPDGTDCFTAYAGTDYTYMGENLAKGTVLSRSDAMEGLKETKEDYAGQGHRRNMLDKGFTAVGIAHFKYNGWDYWVQEFGNPVLNAKATTANDSETTVKVSFVPGKSTPSKVSLTLTWNRDKKATGYQLQYATDKKFKKNKKTVKIKKNKTTKHTIKNLKSGTTYYVRIRSYKKSKKKTKYSKWVTQKIKL
jgi:uncharacterized protein YkwD